MVHFAFVHVVLKCTADIYFNCFYQKVVVIIAECLEEVHCASEIFQFIYVFTLNFILKPNLNNKVIVQTRNIQTV